jgi:hypothetical protein
LEDVSSSMIITSWIFLSYIFFVLLQLLEKELKRKYPTDDIPINFEKPTKFACVKHEKLSTCFDLWNVSSKLK